MDLETSLSYLTKSNRTRMALSELFNDQKISQIDDHCGRQQSNESLTDDFTHSSPLYPNQNSVCDNDNNDVDSNSSKSMNNDNDNDENDDDNDDNYLAMNFKSLMMPIKKNAIFNKKYSDINDCFYDSDISPYDSESLEQNTNNISNRSIENSEINFDRNIELNYIENDKNNENHNHTNNIDDNDKLNLEKIGNVNSRNVKIENRNISPSSSRNYDFSKLRKFEQEREKRQPLKKMSIFDYKPDQNFENHFKILKNNDEYDNHFVCPTKIGNGTYANIFRVVSTRKCSQYAIKETNLGEYGDIPGNIMREISIMIQLKHHMNIIPINGVFFGNESLVIAMQLCPMNLDDYCKCCRPGIRDNFKVQESFSTYQKYFTPKYWKISTVRHIMLQILEAVAYLHSKEFIHRDLKLQNIVINPENQFIKLIDFGLGCLNCKYNAPYLTDTVITLWYRPIELFLRPKHYGQEIDVWSCGIIYFELLQNSPPVCQSEKKQIWALIDKFRPTLDDLEGLQLSSKMRDKLKCNKDNNVLRNEKLVDCLIIFDCKRKKSCKDIFMPEDIDKKIIGSFLNPCAKNRITIKQGLAMMNCNSSTLSSSLISSSSASTATTLA